MRSQIVRIAVSERVIAEPYKSTRWYWTNKTLFRTQNSDNVDDTGKVGMIIPLKTQPLHKFVQIRDAVRTNLTRLGMVNTRY